MRQRPPALAYQDCAAASDDSISTQATATARATERAMVREAGTLREDRWMGGEAEGPIKGASKYVVWCRAHGVALGRVVGAGDGMMECDRCNGERPTVYAVRGSPVCRGVSCQPQGWEPCGPPGPTGAEHSRGLHLIHVG